MVGKLTQLLDLADAPPAAAFYGFRPVLVPHNLQTDQLVAHLQQVKPDFLIAEAGALEIDSVVSACSSLKHVIWVVKEGSRHMDWNVVPEGAGGKVEVVVWHELVDERKTLTSSDVLPVDKETSVKPLSIYIDEVVELTSEVSNFPPSPLATSFGNFTERRPSTLSRTYFSI